MNDNAEVIVGLRDAADFLEAHPELPLAWFSVISLDSGSPDPRPDLERLAAALGARAVEKVSAGDVLIEGEFLGNVRVQSRAAMSKLADEPVPPRYEPIIPVPVDA